MNLRQQVHSRHPQNLSLWLLYQFMSWLKRKTNKVFFVRSTEQIPCPCCGAKLKVSGSRRRVWYKNSGDRHFLIVRRLYCHTCGKTHHELPDLLVPYKRYDVESLEGVVSKPKSSDVAADESTLSRWRKWFKYWRFYAAGCLQSIAIQYDLPVNLTSGSTGSVLHPFGRFINQASKWLSQVVRPIANANLWITDPFCVPVLSSSR